MSRALRALEVIRLQPGVTARELSERLGVTERATRRYVDLLREAEIPIESRRGPYGGYRIGPGALLSPVAFSEDEALRLVMAVLEARPPAGDADPVGRALDKVVRVLPTATGLQARILREHAAAAASRAEQVGPDPGLTTALVRAAAEARTVRLGYRVTGRPERSTEADPWAVVTRAGRWYLLCFGHQAQAVRTYRIDRVAWVEPTRKRFEPPADLDPAAMLEEHLGAGWRFRTRVRFDAAVEEVAPWVSPPMGRLSATEDGCVLEGSTQNPAMYAQEWLAAVPFPFRVEEGPELRAAVAAVADRFAAAIAEDGASG